MSTKNIHNISPHAYKTPPKDINFHFIINQVKYIEGLLANNKLAYDDDVVATINLLARYYRNYKGMNKPAAEDIIYEFISGIYDAPWLCLEIMKACSANPLTGGQAYKALRNVDGVWITQKEIETIKQQAEEEQSLLFSILCFAKLFDAHNKNIGRDVKHLFYVEDSVLRRAAGFKKGTKLDDLLHNLYNKGLIDFVENHDKYKGIKPNRQPTYSRQCCIVDEGEPCFYVDNFDALHLTWRMILGDKKIGQCECGKYFEKNSNRQKKCKKCNPKVAKSVRKRKKM